MEFCTTDAIYEIRTLHNGYRLVTNYKGMISQQDFICTYLEEFKKTVEYHKLLLLGIYYAINGSHVKFQEILDNNGEHKEHPKPFNLKTINLQDELIRARRRVALLEGELKRRE